MTYRDWNLGYGKPAGAPYSQDEARRRYGQRETLTVVLGDPDRPSQVMVVDLGGAVFEVVWLDTLLRRELTYVYAVRKDVPGWPADRLLLEQVRVATYTEQTRPPDAQSSYDDFYAFHPGGRVFRERGSRDGSDVERTESRLDPEQLQAQYEPVPVFGDWASILRRERP